MNRSPDDQLYRQIAPKFNQTVTQERKNDALNSAKIAFKLRASQMRVVTDVTNHT